MVGAKGEFESRSRQSASAGQPGVIDQQMQRQITRQKILGAAPHRCEIAQVQRQCLDLRIAAGGAYLLERALCGVGVAAGDEDPRSARGQFARRDQADAGVGAGHQGNLAGQ